MKSVEDMTEDELDVEIRRSGSAPIHGDRHYKEEAVRTYRERQAELLKKRSEMREFEEDDLLEWTGAIGTQVTDPKDPT